MSEATTESSTSAYPLWSVSPGCAWGCRKGRKPSRMTLLPEGRSMDTPLDRTARPKTQASHPSIVGTEQPTSHRAWSLQFSVQPFLGSESIPFWKTMVLKRVSSVNFWRVERRGDERTLRNGLSSTMQMLLSVESCQEYVNEGVIFFCSDIKKEM